MERQLVIARKRKDRIRKASERGKNFLCREPSTAAMRSFARLFLLLFGLAPGRECPVDLGIGSLWCYFHAARRKQSGHFIRDGYWLTKLKSLSHLGEKWLWWRFA